MTTSMQECYRCDMNRCKESTCEIAPDFKFNGPLDRYHFKIVDELIQYTTFAKDAMMKENNKKQKARQIEKNTKLDEWYVTEEVRNELVKKQHTIESESSGYLRCKITRDHKDDSVNVYLEVTGPSVLTDVLSSKAIPYESNDHDELVEDWHRKYTTLLYKLNTLVDLDIQERWPIFEDLKEAMKSKEFINALRRTQAMYGMHQAKQLKDTVKNLALDAWTNAKEWYDDRQAQQTHARCQQLRNQLDETHPDDQKTIADITKEYETKCKSSQPLRRSRSFTKRKN